MIGDLVITKRKLKESNIKPTILPGIYSWLYLILVRVNAEFISHIKNI